MAEPLKAIYDGDFIEQFGQLVKSVWEPFNAAAFAAHVREGDWEELALKARSRRVTEALGAELPTAYEDALAILDQIDHRCTGLAFIIFPDFVERFGMDEQHWELSMHALAEFTAYSSSEFAVRPFLLANPERMTKQMLQWADDPSEHVRRLASEGTRPRLPWAQKLPMFIQDPGPVIPILEKLKRDPSLYVRKSVANHLNDIAKDHPDVVIGLAQEWYGEHPLTDWIVRRGCRTLVKRATPALMELFGYASHASAEDEAEAIVLQAQLQVRPDSIMIGQSADMHYRIELRQGSPMKLRIEYVIDFIKSSGKASAKRFLLSDREYAGGAIVDGVRTHRFADLTTRKHYAGIHRISLWVNGQESASTELDIMPEAITLTEEN